MENNNDINKHEKNRKQKHNFNDVIIKDNVKQINNNSNDNKNIKLLIPLVELAFKDYMLYTHAREYED